MSAHLAEIVRRNMLVPLCCTLIASCGADPEKKTPPAPAEPKAAPARRPAATANPTALQEATPGAVLEKARARLRLTPDSRFLAAIARVDRFAGNAGSTPVVRFGEGSWHVQIGPDVIGVLPELPGFAEQYAMVLGRAVRVWKQLNPDAATAPASDDPAQAAAKEAVAPGAATGGAAAQAARDGGTPLGATVGAAPPLDELAPVPVEGAVAALQGIDQRWGQKDHSADQARRAAQAVVALCLGVVDSLDAGDALFAQALAAVALAEAASGQPMAREKALLAHRMGHTGSAVTIAATLPADHAARQYVGDEADALVARTKDARTDGFTRMLALRALVRRAPGSEVETFVAGESDAIKGSFPAISAAAARAPDVTGDQRMAYSALIAMRQALGRPVEMPAELRHGAFGLRENAGVPEVAAALRVPLERLLSESEQLLAALDEKPGGPWLPADALVAYHRAQLFSALDRMVLFHVDNLGAAEPIKAIQAMLDSAKGPLAEQWSRYARDIVRAEQRTLPSDELIKDIRELRDLGLGAMRRLFSPGVARGALHDIQQDTTSAIVERCDSRIECRALLSQIAYFNLEDLVSDEMLRVSVVSDAPQHSGHMRLRHVRMQHDRAVFIAAMADRSLAPELRASFLADRPGWLEPAAVRKVFDALVAEAPAEHAISNAYANWLIEQEDPTRALRVIDAWLRLDRSEDPMLLSEARTTRARALQSSGKLKEAWAEIEPLASMGGTAPALRGGASIRGTAPALRGGASVHAGAMLRAALVKSAAGAAEQAVELAQKRLERHPEPSSVALLAQMLWKADRNEDAAALIEQWSNRLTIADWSGVLSTAFAEAHRARAADAGAKAYATLLAKNVDARGARALITAGELPPELAFRTYSQIQGGGTDKHRDAARSYVFFEAWKGQAAAREWIEQAIPPEQRDPLAEHGYAAGAYELVWDFVTDPAPANPNRALIWLMRTASLLRSAAPNPEWRARLDGYYAKNREDVRDRMGLHLLGQMDQVAVWSAAKNEEQRAECAYVFGLETQLQGDVAQAVDWYRVTREGRRGNAGGAEWPVGLWAEDALASLRSAYKSIAVLTDEAKAARVARDAAKAGAGADAGAASDGARRGSPAQKPVGMPATNPPSKP